LLRAWQEFFKVIFPEAIKLEVILQIQYNGCIARFEGGHSKVRTRSTPESIPKSTLPTGALIFWLLLFGSSFLFSSSASTIVACYEKEKGCQGKLAT
jgi:hypothetical protein